MGVVRRPYADVPAPLVLAARGALGVAGASAWLLSGTGAQAESSSPPMPSSVPAQRRRVTDDYELGAELGMGAFAVVRRGRCRKTGVEVAIKVVPISKQTKASIRREAAILQRVSMHTCIAKLEALYEDDDAFYIVMEYIDGGDLLDHIDEHGPWSERRAAELLQEVAGAVALLHAQGLCHADIKPENMLLTADGHVRLVDFGLRCACACASACKRGRSITVKHVVMKAWNRKHGNAIIGANETVIGTLGEQPEATVKAQ